MYCYRELHSLKTNNLNALKLANALNIKQINHEYKISSNKRENTSIYLDLQKSLHNSLIYYVFEWFSIFLTRSFRLNVANSYNKFSFNSFKTNQHRDDENRD